MLPVNDCSGTHPVVGKPMEWNFSATGHGPGISTQDSCHSRSDNVAVMPEQAVNCYRKIRPLLISHEEDPRGQ